MPRSLIDLQSERLAHVCRAALRRDSRPAYIHWKTYGGRDIIVTMKRREGNARSPLRESTLDFWVRLSHTINADPAKFDHTPMKYENKSRLRPEWDDAGFNAVIKDLLLWARDTATDATAREVCYQWFTQRVYGDDAPEGAAERAQSISVDRSRTLRYRDMTLDDVGFWLSDSIKQQLLDGLRGEYRYGDPREGQTWSRRSSDTYRHRCGCEECGFIMYMRDANYDAMPPCCANCTGTMCWTGRVVPGIATDAAAAGCDPA